jgi:hypothetical protein
MQLSYKSLSVSNVLEKLLFNLDPGENVTYHETTTYAEDK